MEIESILMCHILRACALTHTIGIDEEEVKREEVTTNGGIKRSSSIEEI